MEGEHEYEFTQRLHVQMGFILGFDSEHSSIDCSTYMTMGTILPLIISSLFKQYIIDAGIMFSFFPCLIFVSSRLSGTIAFLGGRLTEIKSHTHKKHSLERVAGLNSDIWGLIVA